MFDQLGLAGIGVADEQLADVVGPVFIERRTPGTTIDGLRELLEEPLGRKLIMGAAVMMVLGTLWIRKIIRIEA